MTQPDRPEFCKHIVYDAAQRTSHPFLAPAALQKELERRGLEERIVHDESSGGFFFQDLSGKLLYCREGFEKEAVLCLGLDEAGRPRPLPFSGFHVTPSRIYLIDPANQSLLSIDKSRYIDSLEPGFQLTHSDPLLIDSDGLDLKRVPAFKAADPREVPLTCFGRDILYVIFGSLPRTICGIRPYHVYSYDIRAETLREFEWPLIYFTDLSFLDRIWRQGPLMANKYLALISMIPNVPFPSPDPPIFIGDGQIVFQSSKVLEFDLQKPVPARNPSSHSFPFSYIPKMYSHDPKVRGEGIREAVRSTELFNADSLHGYLLRTCTLADLVRILEPDILGKDVTPSYLDQAGAAIFKFGDYSGLVNAWLEAELPRRYIAVRLLYGKARTRFRDQPLPEAPEHRPDLGPVPEVYDSEDQIPVDRLRRIVKESVSLLKSGSVGSEMALAIVEHAILSAISWQIRPGLQIVRDLAGTGIREIDAMIISAIGDYDLRPLRDLAARYLEHEDALIVRKAIFAAARTEAPGVEGHVVRLLGSSNKNIAEKASAYLERAGSVISLIPLGYRDVIDFLACTPASQKAAGEDGGQTCCSTAGWAFDSILRRLLSTAIGRSPRIPTTPEGIALARSITPHLILYVIKSALRNQQDFRTAESLLGRDFAEALLVATECGDLPGAREMISPDRLLSLASGGRERSRVLRPLLRWMMAAGLPEDTLYLAALNILTAPGMKDINHQLTDILGRMRRKRDFRGLFAALALLELEPARERQRSVRRLFERGDWRGWPVLEQLGRKILDNRPRT